MFFKAPEIFKRLKEEDFLWIKRKDWQEQWIIRDPRTRYKNKVMIVSGKEPPRDISEYDLSIDDIIEEWEIDEEMTDRARLRHSSSK